MINKMMVANQVVFQYDVNDTANNDHKVQYVPRISEIILQKNVPICSKFLKNVGLSSLPVESRRITVYPCSDGRLRLQLGKKRRVLRL